MTIKVDKGISIPNPYRGREAVYPWKNMNIGDSILVPNLKIGSVASAAGSYGRNHGVRFISRTVEGGVRVWRVE